MMPCSNTSILLFPLIMGGAGGGVLCRLCMMLAQGRGSRTFTLDILELVEAGGIQEGVQACGMIYGKR